MRLEEGLHLGRLSVSLWSPAPLHCPVYCPIHCPIHCPILLLAHVGVSLATFLCRSDSFLLKQPLGGWQRVVSFFREDTEPTLSPALTALVSLPCLSQGALWVLWLWSHPATEIPGVSSKHKIQLCGVFRGHRGPGLFLLTSNLLRDLPTMETRVSCELQALESLEEGFDRKALSLSKGGVGPREWQPGPKSILSSLSKGPAPSFLFHQDPSSAHSYPHRFQAPLCPCQEGEQASSHPLRALSVYKSSPVWVCWPCP